MRTLWTPQPPNHLHYRKSGVVFAQEALSLKAASARVSEVNKEDIAYMIFDHMRTQLDILDDLRIDEKLGIEGWFKIELYYALRKHGVEVKISNRGPDLIFENFKLELKATQAITAPWLRRDGLKYPGVDCLFLGPIDLVKSVDPYYYVKVDDHWIIGLIRDREEEK